jgi:ribonuclease Z
MKVIFLGTSGSTPTATRNLPAIVIKRKGELILLDCGEGTQQRMLQAKVGFRNIKIFITHMHGDHVLGLPGILQTMSLFDFQSPLQIFGPLGLKRFIEGIIETLKFKLTFPLLIQEIGEGIIVKETEYHIHAVWVDHSIPTLAYALIEQERPGKFAPEKALSLGVPKGPLWSKLQQGENITLRNGRIVTPQDILGPLRRGRKIVYSGDTRPCGTIINLATDADLLIYEATFSDEYRELANENMHSTPSQGAQIAKEAGVAKLILTHISPRFDDMTIFLKEAKKIFPTTEVAHDLLAFEIPYFNNIKTNIQDDRR